ncbi:MAG: shikimate kinase [Zetaproteobacteria bacterium]|nr:MAG: shikimate kinase [Zetaproteobacteria bacterium]
MREGIAVGQSSSRPGLPVLIGLMGCGKSSIGRRLARALGSPLIDLDDEIVRRAGMTIPELFARDGEAAFRALEQEALTRVLQEPAVIATGGGVVEREANRRLLRQARRPVVWLRASPPFLAARIAGDRNRPLVADGDALTTLQRLAERRDPLYAACADLVIDREGMKKKAIVAEILRRLELEPVGRGG